MRRSFRAVLGPLVALASLVPVAAAQGRCRPALEYGVNPSFQTWSSRAIVFADAFQRVRELAHWQNGPQGPAPLIPLGSGRAGEGWPDPAQLAPGARYGAGIFVAMEGTIPDGRVEPFVVTWRGRGEVRLEGPFVVGERNRAAGRVEVLIDPARGGGDGRLAVSWTATDASDPVRDVHVWLPGMETASLVFWPPFLAKVRATNAGRGPRSWRTLDWTRVNDHGRPRAAGGFVFDLAGAITPRSPSQGTLRGVAPEYQVALCNALGMDLHFQVPHRTDDMSPADYRVFLERALVAIRDGSPGIPGLFGGRRFDALAPGLTVTLELSNEIWNSIFPVNRWMAAEAARKGISFSAEIAGEIQLVFDVAAQVFSGADAPRLRTFVGGFAGDPGYLRRVLDQLRPGTRIDALGPAAYLGPRRPDMDAWLVGSTATSCPSCPDADELLATASATIDRLRPQIAAHAMLAAGWTNPDGSHPALVLYEAGLNLKSAGQPWAPAARALQTDARLFELLVDRFVPMLADEGVALLHWYSFMTDQDHPTLDAFGLWNDMEQVVTEPVTRPYVHEGAPKAAALLLGPPLATGCPPAAANARRAAPNPDTFTAAPPALGRFLRFEVDLRGTASDAAYVIVGLRPNSLRFASGQTLLVELADATYLPVRPGPIATWDERVPNDARLAGIMIATQAVQLGAGPATFTNAMDLTFGR